MEILPLLLFTTCSGAAAGAYLVSLLMQLCKVGETDGNMQRRWLFPLTCAALLGVGLLGTLAHLGQPLRFLNGVSNPGSMISQESYWAIAFGVILLADIALTKAKKVAPLALRCLGTLAACGLMTVTGLAYCKCSYIPAWSDALTIPLFVVGDMALGAAICNIFQSREDSRRWLYSANIAFSLSWLAVATSYGIHLAGLSANCTVLTVGALIGPVATIVLSVFASLGNLPQKQAPLALVASAALGVLLIRGAFFAAGVFLA